MTGPPEPPQTPETPETPETPQDTAPRRAGKRALARFLVLPLLLLAVFAVLRWSPLAQLRSAPAVAAAMARIKGSWWAPLLLVAGYILLCPVMPATPLMIAGAAVFGVALGTAYNFLGVFLGGAATYLMGRLLGRDLVAQLAGKRLRKIERAIATRGFWGLIAVRFLPFPFPVVNFGAALAGVPPGVFLLTSALGLLPTVAIYSYFFATLAHAGNAARRGLYLQLAAAIFLLLAVTFIPQLLQARRRRRRYHELLSLRRARAAALVSG